jgi:peptidoglycan hydrolase CwlO-like protein
MSYKAKDRKLRMQSLKKDIQELEAQVKKMPSEQKENTELISRMKKDIEYLKNRLKNLSYNLEVEIQIFDLQSYIRAEIDKDSPAYH